MPELTLSAVSLKCREVPHQYPRRFKRQLQTRLSNLTTEDEASDAEQDGVVESPREEELFFLSEAAADGQSGNRHQASVPQFQGGGPAVLVKNTFIDVDLKTPSARRESRSKTAPNSIAVVAALAGFSTDEEVEEDYDCEDEVPSFRSEGSSASRNEASIPASDREESLADHSSGHEDEVPSFRSHRSAASRNEASIASDREASLAGHSSDHEAEEFVAVATGDNEDASLPERVSVQDSVEGRKEWRWAPAVVPVMQVQPLMFLAVGVQPAPSPLAPQVRQPAGRLAAAQAAPPSASGDGVRTGLLLVRGQRRGAEEVRTQQVPPCLLQSVALSGNDCGFFRVQWTVDAKKLRGNDKQAVSPPFELTLGARSSSVPFKMMIYPKLPNDPRAGAAFKKSGGKGYVQLKCEAELWQSVAGVNFRITIGNGKGVLAPRGPFPHNFLSSAVCGLPREQEIWDFSSAIDHATMTFCICLEIAPADGSS